MMRGFDRAAWSLGLLEEESLIGQIFRGVQKGVARSGNQVRMVATFPSGLSRLPGGLRIRF